MCMYDSAVSILLSVCVFVDVQWSHNEVLTISPAWRFLLNAHFHFGLVNSLPFKEELSIALSTIMVLGVSAHPPNLSAVLE